MEEIQLPSPEGEGLGFRLKSAKAPIRPCRLSLRNFEIIVILGLSTLIFNILFQHFVSYIATRSYEISSGPKVLAPECLT